MNGGMGGEIRYYELRDRAESFGATANDYERYRPEFPGALIEDLAAALPRRALDVATGTGKVARALAARGIAVLGVELDTRMAAVAQSHGIAVEAATFEEWDDAGRTFDLVTCGDAWHWIDPERGADKVATVLEPGGTFARFFNYQALDADVAKALEGPYRELAKGAVPQGQHWNGELPPDPLRRDPRFGVGDVKTYRWEKTLPVEEWVGFLGTVSDHARLGRARLGALQAAVRRALDPFGPVIRVQGITYASFATRPDDGSGLIMPQQAAWGELDAAFSGEKAAHDPFA